MPVEDSERESDMTNFPTSVSSVEDRTIKNALFAALTGSTEVGDSFSPETKRCSKCREVKALDSFYRRNGSGNCFRALCKDCVKKEDARRRSENPEKVREARRKWQSDNREKCRESTARWYADNRDKVLATRARYRADNPDKVRDKDARWRSENLGKHREAQARYRSENTEKVVESQRKYRVENSEKFRETTARWRAENSDKIAQNSVLRRTRIQQACVPWADQEAIAEFYKLRDKLTEKTGIPHHVDHVIPLKSQFVCGLHVHNNLRVIPAVENRKKHNRFVPG